MSLPMVAWQFRLFYIETEAIKKSLIDLKQT